MTEKSPHEIRCTSPRKTDRCTLSIRTINIYGVDDQSGGEEVPEPPGSWNGHNLVRIQSAKGRQSRR